MKITKIPLQKKVSLDFPKSSYYIYGYAELWFSEHTKHCCLKIFFRILLTPKNFASETSGGGGGPQEALQLVGEVNGFASVSILQNK